MIVSYPFNFTSDNSIPIVAGSQGALAVDVTYLNPACATSTAARQSFPATAPWIEKAQPTSTRSTC